MSRKLFFLISQAQHRLQRLADETLSRELGVSAVQCGALMFLRGHDGCLLRELGEGLGLNSSAVTGLMARLEAARLVTRGDHPGDGRAVTVTLTAKGRRVAEQAPPMVRALTTEMERGFSARELDTVARFLETTLQRLENKS